MKKSDRDHVPGRILLRSEDVFALLYNSLQIELMGLNDRRRIDGGAYVVWRGVRYGGNHSFGGRVDDRKGLFRPSACPLSTDAI